MKIKLLRANISFLLIAVLLSGIFVVASSNSAFADASSKAKAYCAKYTDNAKLKAACEHGYVKGYNKSTRGDCFTYAQNKLPDRYSASQVKGSETYKACATAKVQGKNDRATDDGAGKGQALSGSKCGDVTTFFDYSCGSDADKKSGGDKNPIFRILLTVVAWLTAGVMVAVIGGIVYGGFLYMTAQDNTGQTQKGITVIVDSVIGLIAFGLMWTILNFIIPGGIYN